MGNYQFNISLSVLNHLGRNLYRNFITVLGEAVSNSWDADANNVWIDIDRENKSMIILDDGIGMDSDAFQEKFLKIGYSKRKDGNYISEKGRKYIGRKGIGKLALLSCADSIHILSKAKSGSIIGGAIDNKELDKAITDDLNSQDYALNKYDVKLEEKFLNIKSGTLIYFENINTNIINTIEHVKKQIALYFRFSTIDSNFKIFVNGSEIGINELKSLADKTQFVWTINGYNDEYLNLIGESAATINLPCDDTALKGFIATTIKPKDLRINGTDEKVSMDLFVNGRLRERDVMKHIPTSRIVESYTYGQLFYDKFDMGNTKDLFTSSREGIIENEEYKDLLEKVKNLYTTVMENWDELRLANNFDGDSDNIRIPKRERKAREMFNTTIEDMNLDKKTLKPSQLVEEWLNKIANESQFNIPSYTECFIAENLLRQYISHKRIQLSSEIESKADEMIRRTEEAKIKANISYTVRQSHDKINYLDMTQLSKTIDTSKNDDSCSLWRSSVVYKPLRDSIAHTSLLTDVAKTRLTLEFENIKSRVSQLMADVTENSVSDHTKIEKEPAGIK